MQHTTPSRDKKGKNEIDMVAVNELDKTASIIEIKRNDANINLDKPFIMKATRELSDYKINYKTLSMNDM